MIRITSKPSKHTVCATNNSTQLPYMPIVFQRYSLFSTWSGIEIANGSSNTCAAASKLTPCLRRLLAALLLSHLKHVFMNIIAHKCAYILIERQGKESCAKNRIRNIGRRNKVVLFFFPLPRSGGGGV